ncbi:hypothetical protein POL68_32135 [Stigmatella sp. ncwal1]|uniref:Uncharacterized protein n=1 Tax=Stigmatella ashevillensis TaxID=2995309 RepID=A0ABT5DHM4_9BACT|nr:hypothetical protein [Stigmatella ashevillena]MDC0713155.1 hypothetical protein [Stigmatella ashevillena]
MRLTLSAVLFTASLATACGGPLEQTLLSDQEAEVTSASDALTVGPIGGGLVTQCISRDTVLAQPNGTSATARWSCTAGTPTSFYGTSNDATYGQPACTDRFVTEVTGLNGNWAAPFVEAIPSSIIRDQASCNALFVTGSAWGMRYTSWEGLGSVSGSGIWTPAANGRPASCNLRFSLPGDTGFIKVRVAASAFSYGTTRIRVRTGVGVIGMIC